MPAPAPPRLLDPVTGAEDKDEVFGYGPTRGNGGADHGAARASHVRLYNRSWARSDREEVVGYVSTTWGGPQTFGGPVLSIPYVYTTVDRAGRKEEKSGYAHVLPAEVHIDATLQTERRRRGTFDVVVYRAQYIVRGRFQPGPIDWIRPVADKASNAEGGIDAELQAALSGRYGSTTRRTAGQRSLTMFSAVPVRQGGSVIGTVIVSQSTFRLLQALYDVRLRVFEVVVASLAVAAVLTTVAAMTIVTPLTRLRRAAGALSERGGPLPTRFPGTERPDEIGELARALEELTRRLSEHIALLEGFAADMSHEFKNPLAAIRSAAETVEASDDPEERQRFLSMMTRDVERLERLVSGLRELAHVDRRLEYGVIGEVDVGELVRRIADGASAHQTSVAVRFETDGAPAHVRGDSESLALVFENLLSNAISFAPAASAVDVRVIREPGSCSVTVSDRGPGIPEAHLERVFERFFTYRPAEPGREHLGLGLAIARRVVHGHGGTINVGNRRDGGAQFEVRLPLGPRA